MKNTARPLTPRQAKQLALMQSIVARDGRVMTLWTQAAIVEKAQAQGILGARIVDKFWPQGGDLPPAYILERI